MGERAENDHETFDRFMGVLVDGKPIGEANYAAKRGSLVLELSPTFLEGLSVGKHVVTALFDDGDAQASFVVSNKKDGSAVAPSGDKTSGASASVPQTGDDAPISAMAALCACGFVSLAMSLRARRRG